MVFCFVFFARQLLLLDWISVIPNKHHRNLTSQIKATGNNMAVRADKKNAKIGIVSILKTVKLRLSCDTSRHKFIWRDHLNDSRFSLTQGAFHESIYKGQFRGTMTAVEGTFNLNQSVSFTYLLYAVMMFIQPSSFSHNQVILHIKNQKVCFKCWTVLNHNTCLHMKSLFAKPDDTVLKNVKKSCFFSYYYLIKSTQLHWY